MSAFLSLSPLEDTLALIPGAQAFIDQVSQYDVTILKRVHVQDLVVSNDREGRMVIQLALAVEGETTLAIPNFDFVTLLLGATEPGFTFLKAQLVLGSGGYLELYDFRLAVEFEQPFLQRYDLQHRQVLPDPFRFEVDARAALDVALNLRFYLYNFTIPPFTIGNTGLVLALENCQLDLGGDWSTDGLKDMLENPQFRGIYAQKALLYWLPQFRFPAPLEALPPIPGLRLEFNDVALEPDGVSFLFDLSWQIVQANGKILPDSDLRGSLFDDRLAVALGNARGRVVQNLPRELTASGVMQVPFIDVLLHVEFSLEGDFDAGEFATALTLEADPTAPPVFTLGDPAWQVALPGLRLHGELSQDSFSIQGASGLKVRLPGFSLDVDSAEMLLSSTPQGETFSCRLRNFSLGPLGMVEEAELRLLTGRDEAGETVLSEFYLEAIYSWQDLSARLGLVNLPDAFPLPPDDARLAVQLRWSASGLVLSFSAEVADPTSLWRFLPQAYRPQVRDFRFVCEATYADEAAFNAQPPGSIFQGKLSASLQARLPQALDNLPDDLVALRAGDEAGWVDLALEAGFRPDPQGGDDLPYMELQAENALSLAIFLPGLELPEPLVDARLKQISLDLSVASGGQGELVIAGDFTLRPPLPPASLPMAAPLEALFTGLRPYNLSGTLELKVAFAGDLVQASLRGTFDQADLKFGIFEMLSVFSPPAAQEDSVALDVEIGFRLKEILLQAGTLDPAQPAGLSFELVTELRVGGIFQDIALALSQQEFSLGLRHLEIPLTIPEFPLTQADINALQTDADWSAFYTQLGAAIDAIGEPHTPQERRQLARLATQRALIGGIGAIRSLLHTPQNKADYNLYAGMVCEALHAATSPFYTPNPVFLVIEDASFRIPFDDPANLSLQGKARFSGDFATDPNHPLYWLGGIQLGMGITPETVFFAFESEQPIPLPDFGRYHGGSLHLARLMIGYGFTKSSLAFAFNGKLVLPEQFIEDLDTADQIGVGVRLPRHSALDFKLDIIPIPVGAITIPAPMIRFDLDLRSPGAPGLLSAAGCQPYWDGLQLIVDGVYHDSFKRLAVSPLFTILPIPNIQFAGAIQVGNEHAGFTEVFDNLLILMGLYTAGTPIPIPYLADPFAPYFDNLCLNLRLAGFEVNVNLQRPFPTFNPLILFEVLGLLSDPLMPLDPNGGLANLMRVSLTDAVVHTPPWVRQLFPELEGVVDKRLDLTINLGTFIAFFQQVAAAIQQAGQAVNDLSDSAANIQDRLQNLDIPLDMAGILRLLPPELRKFRLDGELAGFEARAVLVLVTPEETRQAFRRKANGEAPPAAASPTSLVPNPYHRLRLPALSQARQVKPQLPAGRVRQTDGSDALVLIQGKEFAPFSPQDLDSLPPVPQEAAGVLVGAYIKVFAGQRFRFLGYLFDDGSFALVSAIEQKPLALKVAGIDVRLPLEFSARMRLQGRARRGGVSGSLVVEGHATWRPLPANLLTLSLGGMEHVVGRGETLEAISERYRVDALQVRRLNRLGPTRQPARGRKLRLPEAHLELHSDGTFKLQGSAHLALFNGAAVVSGWADISHNHAFAGGWLQYTAGQVNGVDLVRLGLACSVQVGPGPQFALEGRGELAVLGQPFTQVRGRVTQERAEIEAMLDARGWLVKGTHLHLALHGGIDLRRKTNPAFALEGQGYLKVGKARVDGAGGIIKKTSGAMQAYAEGALAWNGRPWLSGRAAFGTDGVTLAGRARFAADLTPSQLPGGIKLASLFLQVDLEASFELNTQAGFTRAALKGSWAVGVRLAADSQQILPIAMQTIDLELAPTRLEAQLLHVEGFKLLPFDTGLPESVRIPVPIIRAKSGGRRVRFGKVEYPAETRNAMRFHGVTIELIAGVLPLVTGNSLSEQTGSIPLETETVWENLDLPLKSEFNLSLVWRNGQIQFKVSRPNRQPKYFLI